MSYVYIVNDGKNELRKASDVSLLKHFQFFFNISGTVLVERFSFACRKVIGFPLLRYTIGLKEKPTPLFHPIRSKPKPIVSRSHTFFPRFASATYNYYQF